MNQEEFKIEDLKMKKDYLAQGFNSYIFEADYHGQKYAVKRIFRERFDKNEDKEKGEYLVKSLKRGIEIQKKLSKFENSVKFYYKFEDKNCYYLILELCDTNLSELLKDKKKQKKAFTSSEILSIMKGLNKLFKYMHDNNIIHRDIKTSHFLIKYVDSSKTKFITKICDFTNAKEIENGMNDSFLDLIGTTYFKAPELLITPDNLDDAYTEKVDLYSIGVVMYELYFGKGSYPFKKLKIATDFDEIKEKFDTKKKKDCEDKILDDLLNKLLIFDPKKRISWEEYFNHPFFNNKEVEDLNNKINYSKINDDKEHQTIDLKDYVLQKTIYQNDIEKDLIKEIDPKKFISIKDSLQSNNTFILGILAQYLKQIGIDVIIEKDSKERTNDLANYHKNIFQFICNSYILKHKHLLFFDLSKRRINNLIKNEKERSNFNEKIMNKIIKTYNLNIREILVTNCKRDENKFTAIVVIKSNFNANITKEELLKAFENDEELKTLSKVDKELITPTIKLSKSMLNPYQDNKNNKWKIGEKRGGEDYLPPLGWINYGINIDHGFNDENYDWISSVHKKGEWCVAYCGITGIDKKMEQIYEDDNDIRHKGEKVGIGVYCYSDPTILEKETEIININGENYKVGFMTRVNPNKIRESEKNKRIWIVNGNDDELRPYGILIKKI